MLNELRELAISLEKAKIEVEDLHPNFKSCPRGYLTYWAYVDKQGNITGIAPVPAEQIALVRKWERANGVSFPAFNLPPPLKAEPQELKERIKDLRKTVEKGNHIAPNDLLAVINACESLWDVKIIKKLTDCLTNPIADITGLFGDTPDRYESLVHLCQRTRLIKAASFREQLIEAFIQSVQDVSNVDLIDSLFYYSGKSPKNFQVILELADRGDFEYPATHQEVQRWMNARFMSSFTNDRTDLDAFGCNASGEDEKYPQVRLPVLGNVIIRAMNQESPCQSRYGMIDHHSFPAGTDARKGMKGALEWLGAEKLKGKTWCDLSRPMDRPMLLFAYPSEIPDNLPDLARMMSDSEEEGTENNDVRFSALAEKVTIALRGRIKETVDSEVRVFVLAKMDKARTKVLASGRYSPEHVIRSARRWQEGNQNIPNIRVRCFGKEKGDKSVWAEPLILYPAEVVWCLNTVWMRQGTHAEGGHGFSVNDGLCLLLGDGLELRQVATRALGTVLRNSSSLLLALGQANALERVRKGVHEIDKKSAKYAKQALLLPSIIGLLLHKLGYTKGEIMASSTFLVGRMFNIADSLHLEYCKHVRDNSVPPQLVGNALMATAQEEPTKALAVLWGRIKPYHAWAQSLKDGEGVGLVKYFLKQLSDVSSQLKDTELPKRCTDADKTQMLLGYLARVESEKN